MKLNKFFVLFSFFMIQISIVSVSSADSNPVRDPGFAVQVKDYNTGQILPNTAPMAPNNLLPPQAMPPGARPAMGGAPGNSIPNSDYGMDDSDDYMYESAIPAPNPAYQPPKDSYASGNTTRTQNAAPLNIVSSAVAKANRGRQTMSPGGGAAGLVSPTEKPRKCLKLDPFTGKGTDIITNFNFPEADIVEIAETLGRLTCLNFIYDKDVKGHISIVSNSQVTTGDAWKAFLTALDANQFSIIPSGSFLRIVRQRDAKDKQVKTYTGDYSPDTDLIITRLIPLKYVGATEVQRVLMSFIPPNARLVAHEASNTLIVTDTGANVKKLVDMIQILDVEKVDERIEVIKLNFASASEVSKLVGQLLPGASNSSPGAFGIPKFPGSPGAISAVRKSKDGGTISQVIPDDRTNSLIVSANEKGMQEVRELVAKLDSRVQVSAGGARINVIYLQYADAEETAKTLNSLAAPSSSAPKQASPFGGTQIFESSIKVAADKPTNSLVITGTASDFTTISQVVSKLDIPRDQVYVEAIIMETTLDRKFDAGVSIASSSIPGGFLPNTELAQFLANPLSLPGVVMGFQDTSRPARSITIPGTNQSISINNIQGLVRLLLRNTKSNVLATPQLLTLDNQEAQIEISEKIPMPTTTNLPGVGVQNSITKENVALTLKIKPQINKSSSFVKLDIEQKLEDISQRQPPKAVQDLAFATSSRSSKTTVVVKDNDTVVIGGLVRDKTDEVTNKIPLLGDIPILGWLFRSKSSESLKQNLLVFITPKIIKQYEYMRGILDQKIKQRDDFLQKNAGGEDSFQEQKMEMIRSLPPLADLKQNKLKAEEKPTEPTEPDVAKALGKDEDVAKPTKSSDL